jgi:hypothetical protein
MIVDMLGPRSFLRLVAQIPRIWWVLGFLAVMATQFLYFRHGDRYRALITAYGPTEDRLANGPHGKLIAYMLLSTIVLIGLFVAKLKSVSP